MEVCLGRYFCFSLFCLEGIKELVSIRCIWEREDESRLRRGSFICIVKWGEDDFWVYKF